MTMRSTSMLARCILSAAIVGVGFLSEGTAFGQAGAEGSIRGYVRDQQGAVLPGATVTATSPNVTGTFIATSDSEGHYRLLNLPPGVYALAAELQGFDRLVRQDIAVRAGLNLTLDVSLQIGSIAETVQVTGDSPLIESSSAVQAVNITGEFQRSLPVAANRHWSDFLAVTPGITTLAQNPVVSSYTLRGSDFASHVMQLDGADMSSAQQSATSYMTFPTEAIEDVQVKTGAVDASSPLGVGGIMNLATKSGTNTPQGSANFTFQRKDWSSNNNPGGTSTALDTFMPEVAVGGPVYPDRLWFFGSYLYQNVARGVDRTGAQLALLKALDPSFDAGDALTYGHFLFLKGTGQLSPKHRVEGFYQRDPQTSEGFGSTDTGQFVDTISGGSVAVSSRLISTWNSSLMTRLGASYNNKAYQIFAQPDVPSRRIHQGAFRSGGIMVGTGLIATMDNGNAGWSYDQPYYKMTVSGDATYYKPGWYGSHEFQSGFLFQINHQETVQKYANNGFSREELVLRDPQNPAAGLIPFWREVYDVPEEIMSLNRHRNLGLFIQDAWRPTPRLTVNLGLRADIIHRRDDLFDVVTQKGTVFGPRFGANYLLTEDLKNSVRASWVRVHDVLSVNPISAGSAYAGKHDLYDTDLDGVFETDLYTPKSTSLAADRVLDVDRGQPYVDEWTLGYKRQLPGAMTVDVSFIRREYRNRTAQVEINGIYDGNVFRGYQNEQFNQIYRVTGNEWNWHVYNGLDFQVTKQTNRVQLLGSYTRAWRHIAGTWQPNDPASFIQPNAFPNDNGIGGVREVGNNGLSGSHMTYPNQGWRDHVLRLGASYQAPWRLILATSYSFESGSYSGPIITRLAAGDPQFGPTTVVLSNGRRVANPLATTLRFAYPTRSEGQLKGDAMHIFNLRTGRTFTIDRHSFEVAMDVFNVTNEGVYQLFESGGNQQFSPNYGKGRARQLPRSLRLWVRYAF